MHARRQADNQQARGRIAERRHRMGKVIGMCLPYFAEESGKARTVGAVVK
jgi:hypothetical protein